MAAEKIVETVSCRGAGSQAGGVRQGFEGWWVLQYYCRCRALTRPSGGRGCREAREGRARGQGGCLRRGVASHLDRVRVIAGLVGDGAGRSNEVAGGGGHNRVLPRGGLSGVQCLHLSLEGAADELKLSGQRGLP